MVVLAVAGLIWLGAALLMPNQPAAGVGPSPGLSTGLLPAGMVLGQSPPSRRRSAGDIHRRRDVRVGIVALAPHLVGNVATERTSLCVNCIQLTLAPDTVYT